MWFSNEDLGYVSAVVIKAQNSIFLDFAPFDSPRPGVVECWEEVMSVIDPNLEVEVDRDKNDYKKAWN